MVCIGAMTKRMFILCVVGIMAFGKGRALTPDPPIAPKFEVRLEKNLRVKMRDGTRLALDVYMPDVAGRRWPVLLQQTPYDKNTWRGENGDFLTLAEQGFAVVVMDIRGTFRSEGKFEWGSDRMVTDSLDTLSWLASQPWSNGNLGTFGCSAQGHIEAAVAPHGHPSLKAMVIGSPGYFGLQRPWYGPWFTNGILRLSNALSWNYAFGQTVTYQPPANLGDEDFARLADEFSPHPTLPEVDFKPVFSTLPIIDMMDRVPPTSTDWRSKVIQREVPLSVGFTSRSVMAAPAIWINSWHDPSV